MPKTEKICHIYQGRDDIPKDETNAYAIEDNRGFGSVQKAADITKNVFLDQWNQEYIKKITYKGYDISWSAYSSIHHNFSLPFTEIKELTEIVKNYDTIMLHNCERKYINVLRHICYNKNFQNKTKYNFLKKIRIITIIKPKRFLDNLTALFVTIFALFYFSISKRKVGIWTGGADKIFPGTDCGFRLVNLYQALRKNKIKFVEFAANNSWKNTFKNLLFRKRFVIYYPSIKYFLSFLIPTQEKLKPKSIYNSVLLSYDFHNQLLLRVIPILEFIYKLIGLKTLWIRAFGLGNAELVIAAKSAGIKTVGMMHGLSTKINTVNEFVPAYSSPKKLGSDVYGVWSPWFEQYFKKNSKIIALESIKYAGLLRPYILQRKISGKEEKREDKIRLFLISEPLTDPKEIVPYFKPLTKDKRFSLAIKLRPIPPDRFYNNLIKIFPEAKFWPKYKGNIFEDGKNADVFIGSYSTAVLEASLLGKLSILVKTKKWGDYFEMKDWIPEAKILVEKPEEIVENILTRLQQENKLKTAEKIKTRFFGENKNGAAWAVKELTL